MGFHRPDASAQAAGRREHSRLRVRLPARLITLDATLSVTLLDLSVTGGKVAVRELPRIGSDALLCWSSYEVFGKVAWAAHGHCGLHFDEPLPPRMLIATRDLYDATPRTDERRDAVGAWVSGRTNRL